MYEQSHSIDFDLSHGETDLPSALKFKKLNCVDDEKPQITIKTLLDEVIIDDSKPWIHITVCDSTPSSDQETECENGSQTYKVVQNRP